MFWTLVLLCTALLVVSLELGTCASQDLQILLKSQVCNHNSKAMALSEVELLTLDAAALQRLLSSGRLTSQTLVKQCLAQIQKHDRQHAHLRAVLDVAPYESSLRAAELLDAERAKGHLRGPFHGIPILVKVGFCFASMLVENHWTELRRMPTKRIRDSDCEQLLVISPFAMRPSIKVPK